jgi:alkanesulfonate monooxygenase SsuD/methylene tetrahydromethanopterin reductase-like flavin-dependent oxidoreductase (luciferase family)
MDEALGIILRLFTEMEPITYKSDWFDLREALLQIRPYQRPFMPLAVASVQSTAGVALAGKFGAAVLTITTPCDPSAGGANLEALWAVAEESAARLGVWCCRCISRTHAMRRQIDEPALAEAQVSPDSARPRAWVVSVELPDTLEQPSWRSATWRELRRFTPAARRFFLALR